MKKTILILSAVFMGLMTTQAKDVFKKYGFKKEILTLSRGKYLEVFKNDEFVQIGTVLLNTKTNKVVKLLQEDTTKTSYKSEFSSRFMTIDPLAEKHPEISPYAFCSNNPVNRVDPDGLDDYSVNQNGKIVFVNKTEDKTDRLIALGKNGKIEYDDKGNMTNSAFTANKGIFANQKESGETTYMSVKGNEQAKGLFEFLGENTTVEWGRISYGKNSNYLTTNNNPYDNGVETIAYEKLFNTGNSGLVKIIDHNHPDGDRPSGFPGGKGFVPKGEGDKAFAQWLYKNYPTNATNILLRVYNPLNKSYTKYNNKKILSE